MVVVEERKVAKPVVSFFFFWRFPVWNDRVLAMLTVFRAAPRIDSLRLHRGPMEFSAVDHGGYAPSQKGR